jgi:RNA polymerase sigma-70 factor (sigma-E family)
VTALYQAHALGMIRLAHIMLGDRASAEDVVQEAFCGLCRRWSSLADAGSAVAYVRSSVLNGCRTVLRRRSRAWGRADGQQAAPPPGISAEAAAISIEERQEVLRALRRLPSRQREALVLRFYLDLSAEESAAAMGIGPGSVRSAIHRGLASTATPGATVRPGHHGGTAPPSAPRLRSTRCRRTSSSYQRTP